MAAQLGVADELDKLVFDGKTLRSSTAENTCGSAHFIAQVSLSSQSLGVAIAQTTYATNASREKQALRQLLEAVEIGVCWCRSARCMRTTLFPLPRSARC